MADSNLNRDKPKMRIVPDKYIRFTEESNALDYLEKAYMYIQNITNKPKDWKWVIISLHGCLYGFAICAIQGTDSNSVSVENKNGLRKLISFDDAIRLCQDRNRMTMTVNSKVLILTTQQKDSIRRLSKQFRNNFEHYMPMSWSIEIHGFPEIVMNILDIIHFLALDSGNFIMLSTPQRRRIKSIIYQSKKILRSSKLYVDSNKSV